MTPTSSSWIARPKATTACLAFGTAVGTLLAVMLVCASFALFRFDLDPRAVPPVTVVLLLATGLTVQVVSVRAADRRAPRVMTLLALFATWAGLLAGEAVAGLRTDLVWREFVERDLVSLIGGALGAAMGVWVGAAIGWKRPAPRPASAPSVVHEPRRGPQRGMVALVKAGAAAPRAYMGPPRTKVSLHAVEHVCPICADDANPIRRRSPEVWECPTCGSWHHLDCYRNNGSACGVLGQH